MKARGRGRLAVGCISCALAWFIVHGISSGSYAHEWEASMEGFLRPKAEVLLDSALIPGKNLIVPPPNQFTHELTRDEDYHYGGGAGADGVFPVGTRVLLVRQQEGGRCHVIDERGLYVEVACDSLRRL
jgi:hypothetical protein